MKKSQPIDFADILREAGFRATSARIELLKALASATKPLTVEEILKRLKKSAPDQATVYRALAELRNAGVVRQIDFQHGHAHYEIAAGEDHHHLVCTLCGRVEDFSGCNIDAIAKLALRQSKAFASVDRHSLELYGVCAACSRKKS